MGTCATKHQRPREIDTDVEDEHHKHNVDAEVEQLADVPSPPTKNNTQSLERLPNSKYASCDDYEAKEESTTVCGDVNSWSSSASELPREIAAQEDYFKSNADYDEFQGDFPISSTESMEEIQEAFYFSDHNRSNRANDLARRILSSQSAEKIRRDNSVDSASTIERKVSFKHPIEEVKKISSVKLAHSCGSFYDTYDKSGCYLLFDEKSQTLKYIWSDTEMRNYLFYFKHNIHADQYLFYQGQIKIASNVLANNGEKFFQGVNIFLEIAKGYDGNLVKNENWPSNIFNVTLELCTGGMVTPLEAGVLYNTVGLESVLCCEVGKEPTAFNNLYFNIFE